MADAAAGAPVQGTPKPGAEAVAGDATKGAAAAVTDTGKGTPSGEGVKPEPGKAAAEAAKAPEKYTLSVPENGAAYVDDAVNAQIEKLARGAGWSNDEAQAALNEHVETMRGLSTTYLTETTADKQYGGEQLDETKRLARLAIAKVRPDGHPYREPFLKFLNRFAGENNINVVAFLADVGRLFAEDSPAVGKPSGGKPKTAEEVLYPKTPAA